MQIKYQMGKAMEFHKKDTVQNNWMSGAAARTGKEE